MDHRDRRGRTAEEQGNERAESERRRRLGGPWAIGEAHWDQRDLYTRDARTSDEGYGRGPSVHPEIGSYAYPRDFVAGEPLEEDRREYLEHEAWPMTRLARRDGPEQHEDESLWSSVKARLGAKHTEHPEDLRLARDVEAALSQKVDPSDVHVTVASAEVTLEGTVPDPWSRAAAEDVANQVSGVKRVHNRLVVRSDDDDGVAFTMPIRVFS